MWRAKVVYCHSSLPNKVAQFEALFWCLHHPIRAVNCCRVTQSHIEKEWLLVLWCSRLSLCECAVRFQKLQASARNRITQPKQIFASKIQNKMPQGAKKFISSEGSIRVSVDSCRLILPYDNSSHITHPHFIVNETLSVCVAITTWLTFLSY